MDFSITKPMFEAGKTPFHRLENQFAVTLNTTGLENKMYQAGTYIKSVTQGNIMSDPDSTKATFVLENGDRGEVQGILVHDIEVKPGYENITVSMAFAGVLYSKVMKLVNPQINVDTPFGTAEFKKNFEFYGVRKASELNNNL